MFNQTTGAFSQVHAKHGSLKHANHLNCYGPCNCVNSNHSSISKAHKHTHTLTHTHTNTHTLRWLGSLKSHSIDLFMLIVAPINSLKLFQAKLIYRKLCETVSGLLSPSNSVTDAYLNGLAYVHSISASIAHSLHIFSAKDLCLCLYDRLVILCVYHLHLPADRQREFWNLVTKVFSAICFIYNYCYLVSSTYIVC